MGFLHSGGQHPRLDGPECHHSSCPPRAAVITTKISENKPGYGFWNDRSSAGRCHERGMIFITCNPLHRHMSSFLVISTPRFRPHVERQTPWPFALTFSLGFGPCGEQHQRSTGVSRVTFDCHHTFVVSQSEEMLVSPSTSSVSSSLFISLNVHLYRSF